jgi:hypothetical protein
MVLLRPTTEDNHVAYKPYASPRYQNQNMLNQRLLGEFKQHKAFFFCSSNMQYQFEQHCSLFEL